MTTKEQFQVFDNYTAVADGTWKVGSLKGIYYRDLVNKLGMPSVVGSGDDKVQVEWVMKYKGEVFTIYDWKTYDPEYTKYELNTWSVGGNDQSAKIVSEFKRYIYARGYNGWNNYATFRVSHDILNDITFEDSVTIDDLKEIVRNTVFGDSTPRSLATDYANLFLNNVDWKELAETYNTDILTQKLNINYD